MKVIRIGLDTSKHVFQIHGGDEDEQAGLRGREILHNDSADAHTHRGVRRFAPLGGGPARPRALKGSSRNASLTL